MDTRSGEIHPVDEAMREADFPSVQKAMASKFGGKPSDYVPVDGKPDPDCQKCKGSGAVPRGLRSKRFKPCKCTEGAQ